VILWNAQFVHRNGHASRLSCPLTLAPMFEPSAISSMVERRVLRYDHAELMSRRPEACGGGAGRRQASRRAWSAWRSALPSEALSQKSVLKGHLLFGLLQSGHFGNGIQQGKVCRFSQGIPFMDGGKPLHGRNIPTWILAKTRRRWGNRSCSILPPVL